MKRRDFSFGEWTPDLGELRTSLVNAKNVVSYAGAYVPAPALVQVGTSIGQTLALDHIGSHTHFGYGDQGWVIYHAEGPLATSRIRRLEPNDQFPWGSSSVSSATTAAGADGVHFTSFGENVLAAFGTGAHMQVRVGDSGNFATVITSTDKPMPKFVSVWGDQVVIANLGNLTGGSAASVGPDPNDQLLWLSATNNAAVFGTGATHPGDRTGFIPLYDAHGGITGLSGSSEWGVVAKSCCMYRAEYGGPFGADIKAISPGLGSSYPNSMVWVGQELYFWSSEGPAVMRYGEVIPLARGRVARSLADDTWIALDPGIAIKNDMPTRDLQGVYDASTGTVAWLYADGTEDEVSDTSSYRLNRMLCYSIADGKFSAIDTGAFVDSDGAEQYLELQGIVPAGSPSPIPLTLGGGLDEGRSWQPLGATTVLVNYEAAGVPSGSAAVFDSPVNASSFDPFGTFRGGVTFTGGFIELEEGIKTSVHSIRPIFSKRPAGGAVDLPSITVTDVATDRPFGPGVVGTTTVTSDNGADLDEEGFILLPSAPAAYLHQFTISFDGDGTSNHGIAHPAVTVNDLEGYIVRYTARGALR